MSLPDSCQGLYITENVDCGKEIFEKVEDSLERDKEWIPDKPEYNNYTDLDSGKDLCEKPWRTMTVNWNGDVVPCGAIYDCSRYRFGNLLGQPLQESWVFRDDGFERLLFGQSRIYLDLFNQLSEQKPGLGGGRLLDPQRAVVVESRDPVGGWDIVRTVFIAGFCHKIQDGLFGGGIVPR